MLAAGILIGTLATYRSLSGISRLLFSGVRIAQTLDQVGFLSTLRVSIVLAERPELGLVQVIIIPVLLIERWMMPRFCFAASDCVRCGRPALIAGALGMDG